MSPVLPEVPPHGGRRPATRAAPGGAACARGSDRAGVLGGAAALGCSGLLAALVAAAATALCVGAFHVGSDAGWRSDGPGILFVMIAVVVAGAVAAAAWPVALGLLAAGVGLWAKG